jgi:hypothetical protein
MGEKHRPHRPTSATTTTTRLTHDQKNQMKNPTLETIKKTAIEMLQLTYGTVALADGDNAAILNAYPDGKTIEIRITEKDDE